MSVHRFDRRLSARRMECLGPFQDGLVHDVIARIEGVFREVSRERQVNEMDLRAWVFWAALRKEVE
jgi:hypothetical protein